jgi:hypothetical protein
MTRSTSPSEMFLPLTTAATSLVSSLAFLPGQAVSAKAEAATKIRASVFFAALYTVVSLLLNWFKIIAAGRARLTAGEPLCYKTCFPRARNSSPCDAGRMGAHFPKVRR